MDKIELVAREICHARGQNPDELIDVSEGFENVVRFELRREIPKISLWKSNVPLAEHIVAALEKFDKGG
ncbi:hypothetical protein [Novosphingobium sp. 9]|uniref:hypothetical protein n=1 Tax=Novosphingobium sp. 9 TaxID=2025349 RepID=UPI0021B61C61|nr:hypothetical protein [Novosphingobium sp. 9]